MQDYDEALSLRPGHILAHLRKGMVLQALKRPEVELLHAFAGKTGFLLHGVPVQGDCLRMW